MTTSAPPATRPEWSPEALADGGFGLIWQGRRLHTPRRQALVFPTRALAELAAEPGQELITPALRMAFTAVDRVSATRDAVAQQIADFAGSDVLCYWADQPEWLYVRQREAWAHWLGWAAAVLTFELRSTRGIVHVAQPPEALARVKALALELDDFRLTGLAAATSLFGSAILAFAVERAKLSGEKALAVSRLDEAVQAEQWGVDAEAAARNAALEDEARFLERWFAAGKAA